jgi:LAO/AO transport system kinase
MSKYLEVGARHAVPLLVEQALKGSSRAIAKLITLVENQGEGADEAMEELYPHTGRAYIIGVTGPPGSGKSTLVDKVTLKLCEQGFTVGIIAIDPSSPFTGGAVLGDRLRMKNVDTQEKVFIRSLSTRGSIGGLSRATCNTARILDACGKDFIVIETVGVGQDEVEIVSIADTTIVVLMPGMGDEIQTIKAGVMEIGDIFVVNKSDREGAERTAQMVRMMLELKQSQNNWVSPVVKTVAIEDTGTMDLIEKFLAHREYLSRSGKFMERRRERVKTEIRKMVEENIRAQVKGLVDEHSSFNAMVEEVVSRKKDPYACARELTESLDKLRKEAP